MACPEGAAMHGARADPLMLDHRTDGGPVTLDRRADGGLV